MFIKKNVRVLFRTLRHKNGHPSAESLINVKNGRSSRRRHQT